MYCKYKTYCKYHVSGICTVDNKSCDYLIELCNSGFVCEHCRHENNGELRKIAYDCFLMPEPPLEPFFSCYNLCRYYDTCDKT